MSKNSDLGSLVNYIKGQVTGRLNAPAYTSATAFTGTIAGYLGFDTSGNILTSAGIGISGSGTTNYIPKFTGSTSLGNSAITDDGTTITLISRALSGTKFVFSSSVNSDWAGSVDNLGSTNANGLYVNIGASSTGIPFAVYKNFSELFKITNSGAAMFSSNLTANNKIDVIRVGSSVTTLGQSRYLDLSDYYGNTNARMEIGLGYSAATGITNIPAVIGFIQMSTANYTNGDIYFATRSVTTDTAPSERMRITADGGLNINTSTTGYTLNAIASTSTQFNAVFKGSGSLVQIMSRFISDTSANKGIAIGYATLGVSTTSGIWATQAGALQLGVLDGTTYKTKINMNTTTIAIDIPSSPTGLGSGQLYNDGNYVRIV